MLCHSYNGRQKWLRQLTESSANCNISLIPFLISFTSRATPPSPFSMLHRKEASSRDRKSNIVLGGGGCIVELRGEMSLKYTKRAKCLNTFGAHCSLFGRGIFHNFFLPSTFVIHEMFNPGCSIMYFM